MDPEELLDYCVVARCHHTADILMYSVGWCSRCYADLWERYEERMNSAEPDEPVPEFVDVLIEAAQEDARKILLENL